MKVLKIIDICPFCKGRKDDNPLVICGFCHNNGVYEELIEVLNFKEIEKKEMNNG